MKYKVWWLGVNILFVVFCPGQACHMSMNGISKKAVLLGLDRNLKNYEQSNHKNGVGENGTTGVVLTTAQGDNRTLTELLAGAADGSVPIFLETHHPNDTRTTEELIRLNITYEMLSKTLEELQNQSSSSAVYNVSSEPRHIHGLNRTGQQEQQQQPGPLWILARQRNNLTKPILIQSLTKSSEYLGFKFINVSATNENFPVRTSSFLGESVELMEERPADLLMRIFNSTRSSSHYSKPSMNSVLKMSNNNNNNNTIINSYAKAIAARLLHEPMTVDEPGTVSGRRAGGPQQQPFTTVLTMQPPLATRMNPTLGGPTLDQEENEKINADWGGDCGVEDWKKCYNITVIGNPTEVHPLFPNEKKKNRQTQLDCFDTMEAKYFPWLCLRNGWTVNRCHILCMSKCNRDLLLTRKWEFYVLHEGPCKTK